MLPAVPEDLRLFSVPENGDAARALATAARRARPRSRPGRPTPMLLAVDGNGLVHRAFHAVGGLDGEPGEAVERVLGMLARIANQARPTACVIGFDDPVHSRRRDRHPPYKAARPPKPMELIELLDELPELLRSLGLEVVTPDGLEADDVLGSAAALASRRQVAATLATGDQDAFALVRPTVRVLLMIAGGRLEDVSPSWLRARYGVGPEQYPAFAALRGDSSDCLPGVRGIGSVTAAKLLNAYPDVEAALADPGGVARLLGPWVVEALRGDRQTYELNRELMAIRTDVPLDQAAANRRLDRRVVTEVLAGRGLEELADRFHGSFRQLGKAAWRRSPEPG
ncbi:MAG TPA: 5'-3' exonuclease H3TH domain-containing protein [Actinomycetes bacterium]